MMKLLSIIGLLVLSQWAFAEALTDEKKQVIDEMLEISGALKSSEMMGAAISKQIVTALSAQKVEPKVINIIREEVDQVMHEEFIANGFFNKMSYEIYHKHFTLAELKQMLAFYKTPIGSKVAALMPQINQEAMLAGQKHRLTLGPIIKGRLKARFEKEGIKVN